MNVCSYLKAREARLALETLPRLRCLRCRKSTVTCFCSLIVPFSSRPRFVILIHRDEARRAIASGRMAHLCLENSLLLEGVDFSEREEVNSLLTDPTLFSVLLFPCADAVNLSALPLRTRIALFPESKTPVIFVLDGTWSQAKKMRRLSRNLQLLPTLSITPAQPSAFHVRKQPKPGCLSTVEAIYSVLELFEEPRASTFEPRPHDTLLTVFQSMVQTQVEWEIKNGRRSVRGLRLPGK